MVDEFALDFNENSLKCLKNVTIEYFFEYQHPYIIRDFENHKTPRGTNDKPFLYAITAGTRNQASLTFHFQVQLEFRQCHIGTVGKTFVYLYCSSNVNNQAKKSGECMWKVKLRVRPDLLICIPHGKKLV